MEGEEDDIPNENRFPQNRPRAEGYLSRISDFSGQTTFIVIQLDSGNKSIFIYEWFENPTPNDLYDFVVSFSELNQKIPFKRTGDKTYNFGLYEDSNLLRSNSHVNSDKRHHYIAKCNTSMSFK